MTLPAPLITPLNYAAIFAQRIQQLIDFYELSTPEFAHQIGLDPQDLTQLVANQPVHQQVVLQLMEGIKKRYNLELDWFVHFDLLELPDLANKIQRYKYERDIQPERKADQQVMLSQLIRHYLKELVPEDEQNSVS